MYCDDVKAKSGILRIVPALREVEEGTAPDTFLFLFGNGLFWKPCSGAFPGFHLDKHQTRSLPGDQVNFPKGRAKVLLQNLRFEDGS
jgi:hypothetical protein